MRKSSNIDDKDLQKVWSILPKCMFVAALLLSLAALFAGCTPAEQETRADNDVDLIPIFHAARQLYDTEVVDPNSSRRSIYLKRGWSEPYSDEDGGPVLLAAVEKECTLRFNVLVPSDRWLMFNVGLDGKYGSLPSQKIEVFCNEEPLVTLDLSGDDFVEQRIFIPGGALRPDLNRIRLDFAGFAENPEFKKVKKFRQKGLFRGVAGYFSEFCFLSGGEEGPVEPFFSGDRDRFFLVGRNNYLGQFSDSELIYCFEIESGTVLAVSAVVQAGKEESSGVAVAIDYRTDSSKDWANLWGETLEFNRARNPRFEEEISLEELAGKMAELRFSARSQGSSSPSLVTWRRMRLEVPDSPDKQDEIEKPETRVTADRVRNVVIIVLDAARPDMFGCYGDARGLTPQIDELARSSVVYMNAVAPAPYTIASVSSIFSGLTPDGHGVRKITQAYPEDMHNLAHSFKEGGYYTLALAGTQFVTQKFGITRSCDQVLYLRNKEDIRRGRSTMDMEAVEHGIKLAAESDKPVFIYAHMLPPHWPYRPPEPFDDNFIDGDLLRARDLSRVFGGSHRVDAGDPRIAALMRHYMNNMLYADQITGKMLELLRQYDLFENSLIIVTSDHGEAFGEHGNVGHNVFVYDEMIRVPLIIRLPGAVAGAVERQVGLIDLFPTIADLRNLDIEGARFEGRSIAPTLFGEDIEPAYYYSRAIGDWLEFTLRGERFKYIFTDYKEEVYDLPADPDERENLIRDQGVLATFLRQQALQMIAGNRVRLGREGPEVSLTDEEEQELRKLGYLQ